jgi:hypothetical protein
MADLEKLLKHMHDAILPPTDYTAMLTCANCPNATYALLIPADLDGSMYSYAIPLCDTCRSPIEGIRNTPAGFGAITALCLEMEERTGVRWLHEGTPEGRNVRNR